MSVALTVNIIYVRFSVNIKKADVHIPSAFSLSVTIFPSFRLIERVVRVQLVRMVVHTRFVSVVDARSAFVGIHLIGVIFLRCITFF